MKIFSKILFCTLFCFNTLTAKANDGSYLVHLNQLIPLQQNDISIQKEVLNITQQQGNYVNQFLVEVNYTVYNPGAEKTLLVGFEASAPLPYYSYGLGEEDLEQHPSIENFSVVLNTVELPYKIAIVTDEITLKAVDGKVQGATAQELAKLDYVSGETKGSGFSYAYYFQATFKPGENILRHQYQFSAGGDADYDYELDYLLTPANRWANKQIDDFTLNLRLKSIDGILVQRSFFNDASHWHSDGELSTALYLDDNRKVMLFNGDGKVLTFHKENFHPQGELYLYKFSGIEYTGTNYIDALIPDFAWVEKDGKYGYINAKGEIVIPIQYDCVYDFGANGLARVRQDNKEFYIDRQGHHVKDINSTDWQIAWEDGRAGFVDANGEWQIQAQFDDAKPFSSNGLAMIWQNNKGGFINSEGKVVVPLLYHADYMTEFSSNGLARVMRNDKFGFVNTKGEAVIPLRYDYALPFSDNGLATVGQNDKYGFINAKDTLVIPLQYDYAHSFSANGLALVAQNDKYGFINAKNTQVIPLQYDSAQPFIANGLALVEKNEKYGFINAQGKAVIPLVYERVMYDDISNIFDANGLTAVKQNGKWGFINIEGKIVIPLHYDAVEFFSKNGLAKVTQNGKQFYIDVQGKPVNNANKPMKSAENRVVTEE